jgi:hypothetical protein
MANVQLTGNFLATARCLIFADGGGITWTFNPNTNTLQASGSGGGVTGLATPTAEVGLTAVAGSLLTAMRSDGAPALAQSIVPTWTGLHTFNAGLTVGGGAFTLSGHTLVLSANASVGGTNTGDQTLPVGANPSASVGLAAVNGTATTWMTSDSAPALSVAIAPTWTGAHTFAPASGTPITITAPSGTSGIKINGVDVAFATINSAAAANRSFMGFQQAGVNAVKMGADGTQAIFTDSTNGDACVGVASGAAVRLGIFSSTTSLKVTATAIAAPATPLVAATTQMQTGLAAYRSADTTSSSNALTADAQLTLTFNETGKYAIEIFLPFY